MILVSCSARGDDWPHWRGPTRNGVSPEASRWQGGDWLAEQPTWSAKVGLGAAAPLVVGGCVYVAGWADGRDFLRCLSLSDGHELWAAEYPCPKHGRVHLGDDALYAGPSATPEYDEETHLLYTLSTDGDLKCRDTLAQGKEKWSINFHDNYHVGRRPKLTRIFHRDYGYTSSAFVYQRWVIAEVGSVQHGSLIAFDKGSGRQVWASELKDEAGHTGGLAYMMVSGVPCLIVLTQRNLAVVRLDDSNAGKTVGLYPWVTEGDCNIATPTVRDNHVLITSAYNQSAICKLAVTLDGIREEWKQDVCSKVCSPVIDGDHVYLSWMTVKCLDWETGKQQWEGGEFGEPGSCIVTADRRLIVYGLNGKLALVEGATRSPHAYKQLFVRDKMFRGSAWPHVVFTRNGILCRDNEGVLLYFTLAQ